MTEVITPDSVVPGYQNSLEAINVALKSISPLVWVRTFEESRFIDELTELSKDLKMNVYCWSLWQGLVPIANFNTGVRASGAFDKTWQPPTALDRIAEFKKNESQRGNIVIMRDVHSIFQEPIPRQIRDIYYLLAEARTKIIFLSPTVAHGPAGSSPGLPPTLEKQITLIDYTLPTAQQIEDQIRALVAEIIKQNVPREGVSYSQSKKAQEACTNLQVITDQHYLEFARALQGLTLLEAKNIVTSSIQHLKTINTKFLLDAKKKILVQGDILEYIDTDKTIQDVGGLDLMKQFFEDYKDVHSEEAKAFGVEPLKGVLLVGVCGTGKSLTAKTVAGQWKVPLIRLDIGKVMGSLVGSSEARMRDALQKISAIGNSVVWLDEVEKALSGTKSSNVSDGGTMARVFGTLLTAMEEGLKGCTFIATANDLEVLPPEFIRRFNEVFFIDLPGPAEREEIFRIHLGRKNIKVKSLKKLIEASDNFTGAEIEKAVLRSLALAYRDPSKKITEDHIVQAIEETKPIYQVMGEKIAKMRSEAKGKYRFASSYAEAQNQKIKVKKDKMKVQDIQLPELTNKTVPVINSDTSSIDLDD